MLTTEINRKPTSDDFDPLRMVPYGYDDTDYGTPARVSAIGDSGVPSAATAPCPRAAESF